MRPGERSGQYVGTPEYMAPEILNRQNRQYDKSVDWWAVGILIFELYFGFTPFISNRREILNHNILHAKPAFRSRTAKYDYSDEFVDIIQKMLRKDAT